MTHSRGHATLSLMDLAIAHQVLTKAAIPLAVVFGSVARQKARADSDIDIAILPPSESWSLAEELALQAELSLALHKEIDLVRLDQASTLLKWQIVRDGQLIFETKEGMWSAVVAEAAIDYMDYEPQLAVAKAVLRERYLKESA